MISSIDAAIEIYVTVYVYNGFIMIYVEFLRSYPESVMNKVLLLNIIGTLDKLKYSGWIPWFHYDIKNKGL